MKKITYLKNKSYSRRLNVLVMAVLKVNYNYGCDYTTISYRNGLQYLFKMPSNNSNSI